MYRYRHSIEVLVLLGVGAAIEFAAGLLPKAPMWMQNSGLEWIFRLLQQPKRPAGRYFRDLKI